jgi:hypothetical protein
MASTYLDKLTEEIPANWTSSLAKQGKPTTNRRTINDFKAALNLAHRQYRKEPPFDFGEVVKVGLATFLAFAEAHLASRESSLSPESFEKRFDGERLFGDDDDHGFRSPHWY